MRSHRARRVHRHGRAWFGTALVSVIALELAVSAVAAGAAERLTPSASGAALLWEPQLPHRGGVLVIAGERGVIFDQRVAAGEPVRFTLVGDDGLPLPDGRYRWELRLERTLPAPVSEALAAAREAGDADGYSKLVRSIDGFIQRSSGRFEIRHGVVVEGGGGSPSTAPTASDLGAAAPSGREPLALTEPDEVSIQGPTPQLTFDETDASNGDFVIEADGGELSTYIGSTAGARAFGIDAAASADSIFIAPGRVGLFTNVPAVDLHVNSEGAVPAIRLEENDGTRQRWDVRSSLDDFQVVDSSAFIQTPNPIALMIDKTNGTTSTSYELVFEGSATINGDVAMGSSRASKTALEPADPSRVLADLARLPLFYWSYREDPARARHFGPMAEDFHLEFGLGRDGKHISPGDSAGLALAAAQALYDLQHEKDREIDELNRRVADLEAQIAELLQAQVDNRNTVKEP